MLSIFAPDTYDIKALHCRIRHFSDCVICFGKSYLDTRIEIRTCDTRYIWYDCFGDQMWLRMTGVLFNKILRSFIYGNPMCLGKILRKYSKHICR